MLTGTMKKTASLIAGVCLVQSWLESCYLTRVTLGRMDGLQSRDSVARPPRELDGSNLIHSGE